MKNLIFLGLFILTFNAHAQQQFVIEGSIKNTQQTASKVFLSYYFNGNSVTDSAKVENGMYTFKGTVVDPILANIRVKYVTDPLAPKPVLMSYKRDVISLFLENSTINLTSVDSFANATVKGSLAHTDYLRLKAYTKELTDQTDKIGADYSELRKKKDTAGMKKLDDLYDSFEVKIKAKTKEFFLANKKSPVAMYALSSLVGYSINADEAAPLFLQLPATVRNSASGKEMSAKIEIAKKTGIGKIAMNFTQNDTAGIPVTLASFKGKYVLVDFWASWCGPCRQENPNVVKAFGKYNAKGFTVLGVSLDQPNAKQKWLEAIHKDNLTWTQVSDLKYWKNEVAVMYGVQAIPQNYLIDPQGKIIGKDLRGDALNAKLDELFK